MIKLIRQGVYYMDGKLVKETHAFMTSEKKEKAVKGTILAQKKIAGQTVAVFLKGKLRRGVGPIDVALSLLKAAKRSNFLKGKALEFFGPALGGLSMETRDRLTSVIQTAGCDVIVWEINEKAREYFAACGQKTPKEFHPKQPAFYDGGISVDLSRVEPMVRLPDGTIAAVSEIVKDEPPKFTRGAIYAEYEEIAEVSELLRGKDVGEFALHVCPLSKGAALNLAENGYFTALIRANAAVCTAMPYAQEPFSVSTEIKEDAYFMDARSIAATAANGGTLTSALGMDYSRRFKKYRFDL